MGKNVCCCPASPAPVSARNKPYWPGRVEYSYYQDDHKYVRDMEEAFRVWSEACDLEFKRVDKNGDIRISFNPGGSWSYIGTEAKYAKPNEATINIGWKGVDTCIHEVGHAIGLRHEHQNANTPLLWSVDGVRRFVNEWDDEAIKRNVLDRFPSNYEWDPDSVMHYSFPNFTIAQPLPWSGRGTPRNLTISESDRVKVSNIYGPPVVKKKESWFKRVIGWFKGLF